jgi:hypothetical protein
LIETNRALGGVIFWGQVFIYFLHAFNVFISVVDAKGGEV